jgi:hypothetical protein
MCDKKPTGQVDDVQLILRRCAGARRSGARPLASGVLYLNADKQRVPIE